MSKNTDMYVFDHRRISYFEFLLVYPISKKNKFAYGWFGCGVQAIILQFTGFLFFFLRQGGKERLKKKPTVAATTNKCSFRFKVGVLKGGKGRVIART